MLASWYRSWIRVWLQVLASWYRSWIRVWLKKHFSMHNAFLMFHIQNRMHVLTSWTQWFVSQQRSPWRSTCSRYLPSWKYWCVHLFLYRKQKVQLVTTPHPSCGHFSQNSTRVRKEARLYMWTLLDPTIHCKLFYRRRWSCCNITWNLFFNNLGFFFTQDD